MMKVSMKNSIIVKKVAPFVITAGVIAGVGRSIFHRRYAEYFGSYGRTISDDGRNNSFFNCPI
ncbi:hypothetical protein [Paenibacillus sp.]|uniref:hypothetical protein n=1 Tax=Paenibacillus sp. TaxID=58172 RepID=UPI0028ADE60B|nr:hypothetical protein [Paenibacillus sp.]